MQQIIDLLDVAAKNYPIKALAPEIGKAESTLRNELTQQDGYKLGLITTYQILKLTQDYRALDRIEKLLGRVAFALPTAQVGELAALSQMIGDTAKEFGEQMAAIGQAMADGTVTKEEAKACVAEIDDVVAACIKLKAYLERVR